MGVEFHRIRILTRVEIVNKLFIGIILIIALSACEPMPTTGTGGADPEFQNLVAIATQTGAAAIIIQTETAKTATSQAVYAEQTAVSYNATATMLAEVQATMQAQAQETAVSATETAVHLPVSVIQTTDAHSVLSTRETIGTYATATAVQLSTNNEAAAAVRWGWFWIGFMGFLLLMGLAIVFWLLGKGVKQWKPAEFVKDTNGNVIGIDKRLAEVKNVRQLTRATVIENQVEQEKPPMFTAPTPTKSVRFVRHNGEETIINATDLNPGIDPMKWQIVAAAVLIDGIPLTRRAITEHNAYINQDDYKEIYDHLIDNELATATGAGGGLVIDGNGYEFLANKLPEHMWGGINLPHPDGYELILD